MWALALLLMMTLFGGYGVSTHKKLKELQKGTEKAYGMMAVPLDARLERIDRMLAGEEQTLLSGIREARLAVEANREKREDRLCAETRLTLAIAAAAQAVVDEEERAILSRIALLEQDIALCKEDYNAAVRALNGKVRSFPAGLIAAVRKFSVLPLFGESKGALAH